VQAKRPPREDCPSLKTDETGMGKDKCGRGFKKKRVSGFNRGPVSVADPQMHLDSCTNLKNIERPRI
jgi:hypothetical protein